MTNAVKCSDCDADCRVEKGDFQFLEFGRPLTLQGVKIVRCGECGAEDPIIPNLNGLMRAVAIGVIKVDRKLTGDEIRFLRKYIGFSSKDFADKLGIDPTNLSKYENGKLPVSSSKDRLIRVVAVALADGLLEHLKVLVQHFEDLQGAAPAVQPKLLVDADTMSCHYA